MTLALITLSNEGAGLIHRLATHFPEAQAFLHESVSGEIEGERFGSIIELTDRIFGSYRRMVYIAPCGVVVRALAPKIQHKLTDPAVVVVDAAGRYAISLLSGHEGGANDLAVFVANILGAEPVVTTTTDALKKVIVGIGCRKEVRAEPIIEAIHAALEKAGITLEEVRLLASADIKENEQGLLDAARKLGVPIRFIASEEIRSSNRAFAHSDFVMSKVNLPAVAEPAALLAGRRTRLLLPKIAHNEVTVALAVEDFS